MSLTMDAAVLRDACALLSSPVRWTCGAWARDSTGAMQFSRTAGAPMMRVRGIAKMCVCTDWRQRRIAQSCGQDRQATGAMPPGALRLSMSEAVTILCEQ